MDTLPWLAKVITELVANLISLSVTEMYRGPVDDTGTRLFVLAQKDGHLLARYNRVGPLVVVANR
jgi:hypothetical protein